MNEDIKADFEKLETLEQQLAEAKAAYAEKPTKELAELIQVLSKEINEVKGDIKDKEAEIEKQKNLVKELKGEEQNTKQAREIS